MRLTVTTLVRSVLFRTALCSLSIYPAFGMRTSPRATWLAEYDYDPYGRLIRETGPKAASCPLRYSTTYRDPDLDLYYYGHRWYDAAAMKWLTPDPIGERGGANLTAFCSADPINNVDPLGLWELDFGVTLGVRMDWAFGRRTHPRWSVGGTVAVREDIRGVFRGTVSGELRFDLNVHWLRDGLGVPIGGAGQRGVLDVSMSCYGILGAGDSDPQAIYTLNYFTSSALANRYERSLALGVVWDYNEAFRGPRGWREGITRIGFWGLRLWEFGMYHHNDLFNPWLGYLGGDTDQSWSGGIVLSWTEERGGLPYALDVYYDNFTGRGMYDTNGVPVPTKLLSYRSHLPWSPPEAWGDMPEWLGKRLRRHGRSSGYMEQDAEQMGLNRAVYGARAGIGVLSLSVDRYTDGSLQALIHDFFSPTALRFQYPYEGRGSSLSIGLRGVP